MKKIVRPILLTLTVIVSVGPLLYAAELTWRERTIKLSANARQDSVSAIFHFQNETDKGVTIQSVEPSCDCTVATLDKKTYGPGESGEIKVLLKIEGRVGRQEKTIAVTTNDAPKVPILLTLSVDIPELVEINPRLVLWRVGDKATEKVVDIFIATLSAYGLGEIKPSDPGFDSHLETIVPNRQYRLVVKPQSTKQPARSTFTIMAKGEPGGQATSFNIYAQVR